MVLVDNGSEGAEASAIGREHGAGVVRLDSNRGFASGVNAGISASHGGVVGLLNDDAVAGPNWLDAAERLLAEGDVAAVAPKVLFAGRFGEVVFDDEPHFASGDARALGRQLLSAELAGADVLELLCGPGIHGVETGVAEAAEAPDGARWRWTAGRAPVYVPLGASSEETDHAAAPAFGELVIDGEPVRVHRVVDLVNSAGCYLRRDGYAGDFGAARADDGAFDHPRECFAASGSALVTTSRVLESVGRLEPSFFAYYEDVDWCWRARLQGFRVLYDPASTVRHVSGQTSGGTRSPRVRHLAERNRLLTLARCAPLRLAIGETRRKQSGGGDDGVAEVLARAVPRALVQRAGLRRRWKLRCADVFRAWAGVDVTP